MPLVWVLASRRSYGHWAAPSCASASSSEMIASTPTAAPNAHSKSPIALLTIRVALVGLSKIVTGTLFGALTSSRRLVLHATSARAAADAARILVIVIGWSPSVGLVVQANGEHEGGELRILGLTDEIR